MRLSLAGFILLFTATTALGQAKGDVESVGFDGWYRPNCWTPMRLRLLSSINDARDYKIQIIQEDLDGDHVSFTRPFTLNGNPDGRRSPERVWVYFRPAPRLVPLLAQAGPIPTAEELTRRIRIYICEPNGRQITQIPIPRSAPTLKSLDDLGSSAFSGSYRGTRLIIGVGTAESQPVLDRLYMNARGINEEVCFLRLPPGDLPGNALGYEAVDAVVWFNADPAELNSDSTAALQDFVRDGGKLVVCQNESWQKIQDSELAGMIPVTVSGTGTETGPQSLRALAGLADLRGLDPWAELNGKRVAIAQATLKPGAVIAATCAGDVKEGEAKPPYIARWMYGLGTVTWVAQDLGDKSLICQTDLRWRQIGWEKVWDKVFDWPNQTVTKERLDLATALNNDSTQAIRDRYNADYANSMTATDLSQGLLSGMELPSRGGLLVGLAMVFFIGYWLVAGPASFLYLRQKNRAHYSWVAFGLCAVVATGLTAVVVRLVLRGPPQLQHVTFVRVNTDGEAVIRSQFGLYIPRDGRQTIAMAGTDLKRSTYLVAYPLHPKHRGDAAEVLAYQEYEVPLRDRNATADPSIEVPYRSTLKKFQAKWVGKLEGRVMGWAALKNGSLDGQLVNKTGSDLSSVHLIYRAGESATDDTVILLKDATSPTWWKNGQSLDLNGLVARTAFAGKLREMKPEERKSLAGESGPLNTVWVPYWDESGPPATDPDRAILELSLFDRVQPVKAKKDSGGQNYQDRRYELLRFAGRRFDASGVVSSGSLLVLARTARDAALPHPLEVDGRTVKGEGTIFYQFVIPIDRSQK